jgi:diadenosine tetraphosphate (Ap4A) HIT family hydrolase
VKGSLLFLERRDNSVKSVIEERIELCRRGDYPLCVGQLPSGWLVMSPEQPLRGYCILLADPVVESLNALPLELRSTYCLDMIRVGDALLKVCGAARINYETWGNVDPTLHTHIVPRFSTEQEDKRRRPLREAYDLAGAPKFDPQASQDFLEKMRAELKMKNVCQSGTRQKP